MKYKEIQQKTAHELQENLKEMRLQLGKFRFELASKNLKNVSQIGKARKDIARILTALKQNVESKT